MEPEVGRASVPTRARSVDFPEPLGPRTIETRPAAKRALTPTSARTGPYVLVTDTSSTDGSTPHASRVLARTATGSIAKPHPRRHLAARPTRVEGGGRR